MSFSHIQFPQAAAERLAEVPASWPSAWLTMVVGMFGTVGAFESSRHRRGVKPKLPSRYRGGQAEVAAAKSPQRCGWTEQDLLGLTHARAMLDTTIRTTVWSYSMWLLAPDKHGTPVSFRRIPSHAALSAVLRWYPAFRVTVWNKPRVIPTHWGVTTSAV